MEFFPAAGHRPGPSPDSLSDDIPGKTGSERDTARLLVVDDDADFRQALVDGLKAKGWDVDSAATGEEGLARIHEQMPDVVLLDYRMPGLTGAEVVERLRAEGIEVAIIFLTADKDGHGLARRLGLELYLAKPCSLDDLHQAICRALGRQ
jgi:CheY-like chemotaxis protein